MALVRFNPGDVITAQNTNRQFYDLLTGAMADQVVAINNVVRVQIPPISIRGRMLKGAWLYRPLGPVPSFTVIDPE